MDTSLFERGDRVLVALSGGADSLALLHALRRAQAALAIELLALHVHHGIRGEAAEADVAFLERLCAEWGIPLVVERRDVPRLAAESRRSLEEAGRIARYAAFRQVAEERGCARVATAHTASDQAETVLLNLLRGTGIDGLAGIPRRRPLVEGRSPTAAGAPPEVVRPLLGVWRRETEAYCRAHGLEPREDVTNRELRYRRARVRHELLPALAVWDPAIERHLVRLAEQAREESALLLPEAEALLERASALPPPASPVMPWLAERLLAGRGPAAGLALRREVLAGAPEALARRAIRIALRRATGYEVELDAALVERLLALARGEGRVWQLPGAPWRARRDGPLWILEPEPEALPVPPPRPLPTEGEVAAPEFGLRLRLKPGPPPSDPRLPPERAALDLAALRPPLSLRPPLPGERFRPLGAPGRRLVSDLLADRKVPLPCRRAWPIVADAEGALWVVGLAIADRARLRPGTAQALHLEAAPASEAAH